MNRRVLILAVLALSFIGLGIRLFLFSNNETQISDGERFALEYPLVGSGNIFVYRSASETADILAYGTGIVFIGFKECSWCQAYAVFLHEVALEMGIDRIYYCDIREDRESGSESYLRILETLAGRLQRDDEGRPRLYVPDLTIVNDGSISARDFETSKETLGFSTPEEYWSEERINALKERLRAGMRLLNDSKPCYIC